MARVTILYGGLSAVLVNDTLMDRPMVCLWCKVQPLSHSAAKYCSPECRREAQRARAHVDQRPGKTRAKMRSTVR